ncbi:hypothetical protein D3C84_353740 [compost metagenome]
MHAVAADAVALLLAVRGDRTGHRRHRALGRRVGAERRHAAQRRQRGHVDDRAAAGFLHRLYGVLAAEEVAVVVDALHLLEQLQRGVLDGADGEDGGVVDQHIEAAEGRQGGFDHPLPIGLAGDVVTHEQGVAADLGGRTLAGFLVEIGEHHLGPFAGQQLGILQTDATGGASDDANLAFDSFHCCSPVAGSARIERAIDWIRLLQRAGGATSSGETNPVALSRACTVRLRYPRKR